MMFDTRAFASETHWFVIVWASGQLVLVFSLRIGGLNNFGL